MSSDNAHIDEMPFQPTASFDEQRIARVYAEALMNAAEKKGVVDDVKAELHELVQVVFKEQPQFETILASSIINRKNKEKILKNVFEGKSSEVFYNFLQVLAGHERLGILRSVQAEFDKLDDQRHRRIPVLVTSAVPLSEDQINRLREDLRGKFQLEPILHTQIDGDIIGGLVVRVGDWVFDHSVRSQIVNIRKQLLTRGSHEIQSGRDRFSD